MTRDEVLTVLKTVYYPGYSRDIVSFGMVSDIDLTDDGVRVTLSVATTSDEQKSKLVTAVKSALSEQSAFKDVEVSIIPPLSQREGAGAPAAGPMGYRSPIPGIRYTIAVASGKGGVGKSTVAVNLAAALSRDGLRVGIQDLDIYGPSLPMFMGTSQAPVLNERQKIVPLERFGLKMMSFGFISGNKTPTIWRGPLVARMVQQFFDDVEWGELDFLIIDLPPGTGDVQLTLVQHIALTGAIIVTTPQKLALLDVSKGADMFAKVDTPVLGVVENMSGLSLKGVVKDERENPIPGAILEFEGLGELSQVTMDREGRFELSIPVFRSGGGEAESRRLNVPLLGQIPLVPDLVLASDAGEPYVLSHPESPVGKEFARLAQSLKGTVNGLL